MKVALIGEGTYPHQFGGVSVWCDQLVRGLPQVDFTLIPLVATGNEPMRWELPGNVKSVATIPLWGRPPSISWRARLPRGRDDSMLPELIDVLLSPADQAQDRFANVMHELFDYAQTRNLRSALVSENAVRLLSDAWQQRWPGILPESAVASPLDGSDGSDGLNGSDGSDGLNGHRDNGQGPALPGDAGASNAGFKRVVPTLGDAVTAMQLLEHALRPFSHPPVQADVAHVVTNGLGSLPAFAAKWRYGTPLIVTEHGVYMREQYLHLRRPEFGWPVKDLYLRFLRRLCTLGYHEAKIITPGNIYNKRWEAELGADESRVRTVYNGVDPAVFPVLSEEPEVPTISWAGRIDPVKDLFTLLRAFSLVVREMPEARLRIFGSTPQGGEAYLERCREEAADLGISEQATFEGRVPEIRDAYAAGHVVALCSIAEGFPYTLIEAMACGRPCVATNVGGVSEAIGEDAGIVVPPRNPAALADACLRLLRDEDMRRTMGTAARERAVEHFTVDRAISAFDEMYTNLAGSQADGLAGQALEARGDVAAATGPQPVAGYKDPETSPRSGQWIVLPPEEESTVLEPRLDAESLAETDEDATQIVSVLGRGSPSLDADSTMILPRLVADSPEPPDEARTAVLSQLRRARLNRARPNGRPAEPVDQDQTRPVRLRPAKSPDLPEEAEVADDLTAVFTPLTAESWEPSREDDHETAVFAALNGEPRERSDRDERETVVFAALNGEPRERSERDEDETTVFAALNAGPRERSDESSEQSGKSPGESCGESPGDGTTTALPELTEAMR
jgi:glycosyltransferase involved in cell wall biosynthesis